VASRRRRAITRPFRDDQPGFTIFSSHSSPVSVCTRPRPTRRASERRCRTCHGSSSASTVHLPASDIFTLCCVGKACCVLACSMLVWAALGIFFYGAMQYASCPAILAVGMTSESGHRGLLARREPGHRKLPARRKLLVAPDDARGTTAGGASHRRREGQEGLSRRPGSSAGRRRPWVALIAISLHAVCRATAQRVVDCGTTPTGATDLTETACLPPRANLNPDVRYFKVCACSAPARHRPRHGLCPAEETCARQ
jgi:hypothetical protein